MLPFEVTVLGCSSATPTSDRHPSAQVLNVHGRLFLIDCGEAAQIQVRKYGIRLQKISQVFISHLHGDHFFGLVGLLSTMHLLGRSNELHIHAPHGLQEIIEVQHKYSDTHLRFPTVFHELDTKKETLIFDDEKLSVTTLPLLHRVPCCGFLFREKPRPRNINREKLEEYKIPLAYINLVKSGEDYTDENGKVIPNKELTLDPPPPRSYAYCSDTAYNEALVERIRGADLLYHEATFTEDMRERAKETLHSTAKDAATIAMKATVKKLLIGHYSARYNELWPLLEEAQKTFPGATLAEEGKTYLV
ncbi:MAG TPA: ribonuclease Z [Bacteroidia bacterium]|jgi:ribonuclease Z